MKKSSRVASIGGVFALLAGFGFAVAWRIGQALSNSDIRLLIGGCVVLVVVLTVGALFVAWSVSQNRLYRQILQQDDLDELKKMEMIYRLGGRGKAPTINVKAPDNPQLPPPVMWPYPVQQSEQGQRQIALDGEYRDSINLE